MVHGRLSLKRLRTLFRSSWMLPALVGLGFFAIGAVVTVVTAAETSYGIQERRAESFEHEIDDLTSAIKARVEAAAAILAGLDGLLVSGEVGRGEFQDYVGRLEDTPGFDAIQALEYTRLVTRDEVSQFEAQVRSDTSLRDSGYPDFVVHPAGEFEDLFVVDYVEPLAGNESAFGFDLGSNPARREAVEKARDTGELVATAGINLVQDSTGATGFLLMLPVYIGETDDLGIDERREQFIGVVNGVFRIPGLLADVMESRPGILLSLIDAGAPGDPVSASSILFTAGSGTAAQEGALSLERSLQVGDRRWIVAASESSMGFGDPVLGVLPELLLILGLATSAAIGFSGYALMNSRQKAATEARRATAHLLAQTDELRKARDKALEADSLKTSFLANMSHELRTPLSAVIGLGGILANESIGPLNQKQLDYVKKISNSGGHLLELIDDLLDLARIEAGKEPLDQIQVDLFEALRESVEIVRSSAPDGMIELVEAPNQEPIIIHADARRLRQVVINLLTNAVKFTPAEGRVGVEATKADDSAEIIIWDTGIGIEPAELDRIFEPFHQIDSTLARKHGGTGLGLALSRRIVEMHGGRITVTSEMGAGSRFRITWPLSSATEEARPAAPMAKPAKATDFSERERTVVVAEDNDINLALMSDLLQIMGWRALEARNGAEAVELTRSQKPNLVLMDVQMPIMDGLAATRLLKADPTTASIPVLAVTAFAMPDELERCLNAGCEGYLVKPFTPEEFEGAVLGAVSRIEPANI